jgi:hypothetical protein
MINKIFHPEMMFSYIAHQNSTRSVVTPVTTPATIGWENQMAMANPFEIE